MQAQLLLTIDLSWKNAQTTQMCLRYFLGLLCYFSAIFSGFLYLCVLQLLVWEGRVRGPALCLGPISLFFYSVYVAQFCAVLGFFVECENDRLICSVTEYEYAFFQLHMLYI